jgi:carbonic anhydrase
MKVKKRLLPIALLVFLSINCPVAFSAATSTVDSETAVKMLKEGYEHFVSLKLRYPNLSKTRRLETAAKGQHPFAAVLACSDSRVPVELIFDRGIGDLFVMRVAGNVADNNEIGTAQYAVEHIGIPLLVILGHTKCGAVTAAATHAHADGQLAELLKVMAPSVQKVESEHPGLKGDALIEEVAIANVRQVIANMLARSPALRTAHEKGTLEILGAVYDIETGKVEWLE